ncbi:MAG: hypothetical protein M1542_05170 [Thermotogae bacterium]|jgi:hypothetical protein|nr:hypothetical protein [Thermotogota bacterium]MCL5032624.1 hypothetical protein [Thermotogota bacterium]
MKRYIFLLGAIVLVSLILSSCAMNVFKGLNTPANIETLSQLAVDESNNGNFKDALSSSAQVLSTVSNSTIPSTNLYNAVALSDASTSARTTLASVTYFLNTTKSTSVALKNAAEAMLNSINGMMGLNAMTLANNFISLYRQSQNVSVSSVSTVDYALVFSAIKLIVSSSHNLQLIQLLEALSSTLNRFDSSNSAWLVSKGIYAALQIPIILFDSNGNGMLDPQDQIFTYLWNRQTNTFKSQLTSADYNGIMNVQLQTYNNIQKSNEVIADLSTALTNLDSGLPSGNTLKNYITELEMAMYLVNAQTISQIRCLGDIQNYISL